MGPVPLQRAGGTPRDQDWLPWLALKTERAMSHGMWGLGQPKGSRSWGVPGAWSLPREPGPVTPRSLAQ